MMKTNDEIYEKVKSDVKRYLENNLGGVQCVTDVMGAMKDKSINIEIKENIDIDHLYVDLSRYQRTAQLILNLYTDFETYRSCLIDQSINKYGVLTSKYFETGWSEETPKESDVIQAISDYVLCYLRVQYYEVYELIKKSNMKLENVICPMCDTAFCDGNLLCPCCSYSIIEAMKDVLKSQKKVKKRIKNHEQEISELGQCETLEPVSHQEVLICKKCKNCKTIIGDEMCGDCFKARSSDWICPYEFCGKTNNSNAEYCESCGIERSHASIIRALVWRKRNGNLDQIWVCGKCNLINEIDTFKHCQVCDVPMDKSSEIIANQEESKRTEEMINSRNSNHKVNNQSNIYQENKHDSMICEQCNNVKKIFDDEMCKDCFDAQWSYWICPYESCKSINTERNKYCKSCGIKRSPGLIVDTPIERWKNDILDKVWICGKRHHLNENIEKKICGQCSKAMNKSSQRIESHSEKEEDYVFVENNNTMEYQGNNQLNFDHKRQWKCERCKLINDVAFLSCRFCSWARAIIWTCSHCSKENEESVEQCGACGHTNKSAEKKLCVKCRRGESIINGLCAKCESERLSDWECLYRFCGNINIATEEFCQKCGLCRRGFKEHGEPIFRIINNKCCDVWICFDCGGINYWWFSLCQNIKYGLYHTRCGSSRDKYFRWCGLCKNKNELCDRKCSNCDNYFIDGYY